MKNFFALIVAIIFLAGCGNENATYERTEKVFGTPVTLRASGANAKIAVDESFAEVFALIENLKTDAKNLNDAAGSGEFVKVSPEVFEILQISKHYAELTGGAFDVTIGAAADLWKVARKNKTLPSQAEIAAVKNFVGIEHLQLNDAEKTARLDKVGVKINLGGVGKGYGLDVARKVFAKYKISDGLLDFGTSSIFAFGQKKIGVKNPRNETELVEVLEVANAAISTSGDYEQFFELGGRRYHHIIDPKTCAPTENKIMSATVAVDESFANCGTVADILSTSIFILGEDATQKIIPDTDKIKIISVQTE